VYSAGFPLVTAPRPADDATRRSSFRELVEPEIEVLLRVALTITSIQADAEDLVQETLLRAYRAIDRFDGRHPRAWLLTILRNTNANMHRRQRPGTIGDWELIRTARPAFGRTALPSAEDSFVDHELHADLDAAVRALDPRFRAALILVDVHDLSYAEAAAVMGVPVGTVMSRLSRARDRIRKSLRFPLTRGDLS
jgi:RNA polymerase sigma-70 factor (ECF subfamily)